MKKSGWSKNLSLPYDVYRLWDYLLLSLDGVRACVCVHLWINVLEVPGSWFLSETRKPFRVSYRRCQRLCYHEICISRKLFELANYYRHLMVDIFYISTGKDVTIYFWSIQANCINVFILGHVLVAIFSIAAESISQRFTVLKLDVFALLPRKLSSSGLSDVYALDKWL